MLDSLQSPSTSSIMFLVLVGILLIPFILYLLTLQNTLKAISQENRKMEPGMVWLMFIPLFNLVWNFIMVNRMADSIQAQLNKTSEPVSKRPAHAVGTAMAVLYCCGWIPVLGTFLSFAGLICWIIYWVRISEFKTKIESRPNIIDPDSSIFGREQL